VKKAEAVNQALRAALDSWNWRPPPVGEIHDELASPSPSTASSVRTELSATVYSAEAADWVRYLKLPPEQRYESDLRVRVHVGPDVRLLAFEAENPDSQWLSGLLHQGLELLREQCEQRPNVRQALEELLFDTGRDDNAERLVRLSPDVPSDGSRETALDDALIGRDVRLVLHSRLVRYVRDTLARCSGEGYALACEALAAADLRDDSKRIIAPTFVICGEQDIPSFLDAARWLAANIAGAKCAWIARAQHASVLERPQEGVSLLRDFLR